MSWWTGVPSFAPDGQTIAFVQSSGRGGNQRHRRTVGADGSEETFLTETGLETDPSWSPDASRIAFLSDPDLYGGVALMNADGSDLRIVFRGSSLGRPTWSPDGTALAFETDSGIVNASANGLDPVTIVGGRPTTQPGRQTSSTSRSTARRSPTDPVSS